MEYQWKQDDSYGPLITKREIDLYILFWKGFNTLKCTMYSVNFYTSLYVQQSQSWKGGKNKFHVYTLLGLTRYYYVHNSSATSG